jgi:hypothetical protein
MVMHFGKDARGQLTVHLWAKGGSAAYEALKGGAPYDESKLQDCGTLPVTRGKDGTFSFVYKVLHIRRLPPIRVKHTPMLLSHGCGSSETPVHNVPQGDEWADFRRHLAALVGKSFQI